MHKTTELTLIDKYEGQLGGWGDRPLVLTTRSIGQFGNLAIPKSGKSGKG
ncbi:hypothetical protein [Microcoleus sp. Pol14C6]